MLVVVVVFTFQSAYIKMKSQGIKQLMAFTFQCVYIKTDSPVWDTWYPPKFTFQYVYIKAMYGAIVYTKLQFFTFPSSILILKLKGN